jgi:hypothetical protein
MHDLLAAAGANQAVYTSEWLGYLPFGLYHWVECNHATVSDQFPADWTQADLVALERCGFLARVSEWQDPDDEFHSRITYRVGPEPQSSPPSCDSI